MVEIKSIRLAKNSDVSVTVTFLRARRFFLSHTEVSFMVTVVRVFSAGFLPHLKNAQRLSRDLSKTKHVIRLEFLKL